MTKKCKSGEILKSGYKRKGYYKTNRDGSTSYIKPTYVDATCIHDVGKPGKGEKKIMIDDKIHLSSFGWKLDKTNKERREALNKAVNKYGQKTIRKRLQAIKNITAEDYERNHNIYQQDLDYLDTLKDIQKGGYFSVLYKIDNLNIEVHEVSHDELKKIYNSKKFDSSLHDKIGNVIDNVDDNIKIIVLMVNGKLMGLACIKIAKNFFIQKIISNCKCRKFILSSLKEYAKDSDKCITIKIDYDDAENVVIDMKYFFDAGFKIQQADNNIITFCLLEKKIDN